MAKTDIDALRQAAADAYETYAQASAKLDEALAAAANEPEDPAPETEAPAAA